MAEEIDRFVPAREAEHIVGRKRCWLWRQAKAGAFPAPVRVAGRNYWKESELRAWMAEQERHSRESQPEPMKAGLRRYMDDVAAGRQGRIQRRRRVANALAAGGRDEP